MKNETMTILNDMEKPESTELFTKEEIENSPMTIIGKDGVYFGTLGQYKITEDFMTPEGVKENLTINWNNIIKITTIINEILKK